MKKMGIAVAIFFGVILLTSTVLIALPGLMKPLNEQVTITGTPADNYVDMLRPQYCGTGEAKSTAFVKEYKIPTECTNPMAITTDHDGNVWFAQSNTGNIVKFDPDTEEFTEFENPLWPDGGRSMMWGIDYAPDGSLWFTDDIFDSIWRFSTFDESYSRLGYPAEGSDALLQKIQVFGSNLIFNDFTGGNLVVATPTEESASMFSIPQILNGSVTSDFATDEEKNVWFTSWVFEDSGVLAKFDYEKYLEDPTNPTLEVGELVQLFPLHPDAKTINGVEYHPDGVVWLVDTSSSFFFAFDPTTGQYTKFVTSDPHPSSYGNATGVIKTPESMPYWIEAAPDGSIVFNEQAANRIAVFDPREESLTEYMIPSKNPNWSDCGDMKDCGIAQVFGFTIHDSMVWFTEWVENNIGMVDTSVELPFEVVLESGLTMVSPGSSNEVRFTIVPKAEQDMSGLSPIAVPSDGALDATIDPSQTIRSYDAEPITATIDVSPDASPGQYKMLLGAEADEVSISKFLTVIVLPIESEPGDGS